MKLLTDLNCTEQIRKKTSYSISNTIEIENHKKTNVEKKFFFLFRNKENFVTYMKHLFVYSVLNVYSIGIPRFVHVKCPAYLIPNINFLHNLFLVF